MLAEIALEDSENGLAGATTGRGLVVIDDDANRGAGKARLYFVAGDRWGFNYRRIILDGAYDELAAAVKSASEYRGVSETAWMPLESIASVSIPPLLQAIEKYEAGHE